MPLPSSLPYDLAEPLGRYVDCTSLGHCLWPWWLTCFGQWKFSRHDVSKDLKWIFVMFWSPVFLLFVKRRTRSMLPWVPEWEDGCSWAKPNSQPRDSSANSSSLWLSHIWPADHEQDPSVDTSLWALWLFITEHYAVKSWLMGCFLHGFHNLFPVSFY